MCNDLLQSYVILAGPLATLISGTLWYMDSKDITFPNMAEVRYSTALLIGIPGLVLALCQTSLL